jgi:hypothetical protein
MNRAAASTPPFGIFFCSQMRGALKILVFFVPLIVVSTVGGGPSRASNPPTVQYCDLIANPALYDGKEIRLHGTYSVAGSGYSRFFSSSCTDKTLWVEYDPNYETCSGRNAVKSLAAMRRNSGGRWARPHVSVITVRFRNAEVEFTGRFTASNPFAKPAAPETDGPLGPIRSTRELSDFVFTVTCINSLRPLPKDAQR